MKLMALILHKVREDKGKDANSECLVKWYTSKVAEAENSDKDEGITQEAWLGKKCGYSHFF